MDNDFAEPVESGEVLEQEGVETPGVESTEDGGGQEQQQVEQPAYITKDAFEAAMSESTRHVNDSINNLAQQMYGISSKLSANQETNQKPPIPQLTPDNTIEDLQRTLQGLHDKFDKKVSAVTERIEKAERVKQERERTDQMYNYVVSEIDTAAKQYDVFGNNQAKEILKMQVTTALHQNHGDVRRVSIPAIAKQVNDMIKGFSAPPPPPPVASHRIPPSNASRPMMQDIDTNKNYSVSDVEKLKDLSLQELEKMMRESEGE